MAADATDLGNHVSDESLGSLLEDATRRPSLAGPPVSCRHHYHTTLRPASPESHLVSTSRKPSLMPSKPGQESQMQLHS